MSFFFVKKCFVELFFLWYNYFMIGVGYLVIKKIFFVLMGLFVFIPFVKAEPIGTTSATITGTGYEIVEKNIKLGSDANVELSGDVGDYAISVNENASNVVITLNNYTAVNGGWVNSINLGGGSSAKLVLVGVNSLQSGAEASAIRVPSGTSLVIDGEGELHAKVVNGGSAATSAVIGSAYDGSCGNIIINNGIITTEFQNSSKPTGIGTGSWNFNSGDIEGTIVINGGVITTNVIGTTKASGSKITLGGSGNAIINVKNLEASFDDFNGIVVNTSNNSTTVKGDAVLTRNYTNSNSFTIPADASLTISEGVTLTNEGNMSNLGSIVNYGTVQNEGTLDNSGDIRSDSEVSNITGTNTEVIPFTYSYVDEEKVTFTKDEDDKASFRIVADYSLFENGGKVYVDDVLVDSNNYTSASGSTIINLLKSYLDTLTVGDHTLKVTFNNGAYATTNFAVANKVETPVTDNSENTTNNSENTSNTESTTDNSKITSNDTTIMNPKTGDNMFIYFSILGLSIIGCVSMKKMVFNN